MSGTPGPWFIESHGIMDETRSRTICIFGDSEQDDADLVLVASAPALRDALFALVDAVEAHKRYWPRVDWGSEHCERALLAALDGADKALDGLSRTEDRARSTLRPSPDPEGTP